MIKQSITKEFQLIFSDLHSLAVLLIMPLTFMVIMTFALSNDANDVTSNLHIKITTAHAEGQQDNVAFNGASLLENYLTNLGYTHTLSNNPNVTLTLSNKFEQQLFQQSDSAALTINFNKTISPQLKILVQQHIELALAKVKLHLYLLDSEELSPESALEEQMALVNQQTSNKHLISYTENDTQLSAIAHSIPAWLVFGVFFIVLPMSTTLINESQNGTLIRIKTFPISSHKYFFAKIISFYIISLCQALLLTIIGFMLIPLLVSTNGANILTIMTMLPFIAITCASAVLFGAVISTQVKSYEQAIVLGGGVNIILAALSGLMVPLDIMPDGMKLIANISPMYWASEGLRSLYNGSFNYLGQFSTSLALVLFSLICCALSFKLFLIKLRTLTWS